MNQRDEIEAVCDGVMVADLLIAAVALIFRVKKHMKRKCESAGRRNAVTDLEGAIVGRVVDGENLNLVLIG